MNRRLLLRVAAAGAAAALTAGQGALAQEDKFPSRAIQIVAPFPAGGSADLFARVVAQRVSAKIGHPVIIEPKPGASGILAADFVAKAAPDGHTVMFTLPLTHVNNAILHPKLPYDPVKDFTPLSMIGTGGPALVARADAPYNTVREFVEYAKKQPKGLTYGTWGNGSTAHLFCELLRRQTGTNLIHAPYKSETAAHNDMFGGVLDFAWANPSTARAQLQGGRMKVLGITGTTRASILPDVTTFKEQGFQGYDIDSWIGVYGPAGLPQAVVTAWVDALRDITHMEDIRARLTGYGFEPLANTPAEFMARYRADYPRMAELIKAAGVTAG
jgi:tripartite-type tricarboxylate transporter receptor subunit TctC